MRVLVVAGDLAGRDASRVCADVVRGWRAAAPHDEVRALEIPETVDRACTLLGLPDVSAYEPHDAVATLDGEDLVAVGTRIAHDGGAPFLHAAIARWGSATAARAALSGTVFASDDPAPLRGLRGAGARRADAVGAERAQRDEAAVGEYAAELERELAPCDLVSGTRVSWSLEPFSGAGGGVGFTLLALGARAAHVRDVACARTGAAGMVEQSDLVVAVLDTLGVEELSGSVLTALAPAALEAVVPVVAIVDEDHTSRRQRASLGVVGTYETRNELEEVAGLAARVARTWSPQS